MLLRLQCEGDAGFRPEVLGLRPWLRNPSGLHPPPTAPPRGCTGSTLVFDHPGMREEPSLPTSTPKPYMFSSTLLHRSEPSGQSWRLRGHLDLISALRTHVCPKAAGLVPWGLGLCSKPFSITTETTASLSLVLNLQVNPKFYDREVLWPWDSVLGVGQ